MSANKVSSSQMRLPKTLSLSLLALALSGGPALIAQPAVQSVLDKSSGVSSAAPMDPAAGRAILDDLMKQMNEKAEDAEKYGGEWGSGRWVTMVMLIVLSAIVAAEKTFNSWFTNVPGWLKIGLSICAIAVAILTAFDQAAKPGTRWRLSTGYATKFRGLKTKARTINPADRAAIVQLSDELQALDQKWLDDTTF
jgi:hypothetical protein